MFDSHFGTFVWRYNSRVILTNERVYATQNLYISSAVYAF